MHKKTFAFLPIAALLAVSLLTACGSAASTQTPTAAAPTAAASEPTAAPTEAPAGSTDPETADEIVIYFSATGTTRAAAESLAETTGADLYELVPAEPYTDEDLNYNDSTTRATVEQNDDTARPALAGELPNLTQYDRIYLGYPIWWGDLPKIVVTFLEGVDLTGKTVAPFCTSGGSGISGTAGAIAALQPGATVIDGLTVRTTEDLTAWLAAME